MKPISRRAALTAGGVGLMSVAVGGTGLWQKSSTSRLEPVVGSEFIEPDVLRSEGGELEVRLEAAMGPHEVAGRQTATMGFNGGVPGPTLMLRPGDTLRLELVNKLAQATNLHMHGLHVSPQGNSDNIFLTVEPGASLQYEYALPEDHPPGVFWYHPHRHGTVADQVFGGLYGAVIIDDDSAIAVDRDRVMVISDITLDQDGSLVSPSRRDQMNGREGELVLLNGRTEPVLEGKAGQRERWRVVNACTSRFLDLALSGQDATVIGRDIGRLASNAALDGVVLAPGNRLDLIVDLKEGGGELSATPVDRGATMGHMMGGGGMEDDGSALTLARTKVTVGDGPVRREIPAAPALRDLRQADIAGRRTLTFQEGMGAMMNGGEGGMSFTFGGREFDADRIDQRVTLGAVEEWVIGNDSSMDHPFHLHVWPMQVLEVGGREPAEPQWLDVVNVPARSQVTVRVAFEDFGGRTVYHCHILDHEDRGMMGTVLAE